MPNLSPVAIPRLVKKFFHACGLDIVRLKNVPLATMAGLRDRPIRTIIDCGANEGQFARYISRFFPDAYLYCFEPLDEPFQCLSDWAATQGNRVRCFKLALGDRNGVETMHYHINHSSSSSLLLATEHEMAMFPQTSEQTDVTVPLSTLDTALNDTDDIVPEVLLKLDVQGYESRVLRGATKLLKSVHTCLLEVNVDPLYETQATFKDLVTLLDEHGLKYAGNLDQSCAKDGRVMWLDALFVRR